MKSKKDYPTVSVIIPTYNRAHLLRDSVESILKQTYNDFEIIIVDDGSEDNTKEVVNSFNDKRIKYFHLRINKGLSVARNTGIKESKGMFIAFQDSDDFWLPEKLAKQMKIFDDSSPQVGVVYTGFIKTENKKKRYIPYSWVMKKEGNIHYELLKGSFIGSPTLVIRKECFDKVGLFDEDLPHLEDWELVLRLSKEYEFRFIDESLLLAGSTHGSITSNEEARINALMRILSKHMSYFENDIESLYKYYVSIAIYLSTNGNIAEGNRYLIDSFKLNNNHRLLSNHYFKIARRLWANGDISNGQYFMSKAFKMNPGNLLIPSISLLLILNPVFYKKILSACKKIFRSE